MNLSTIYSQRLNEVVEFLPTLFESPLQFNSSIQFETDGEKRDFSKDSKSLKQYWSLFITNQTLQQYMNLKMADVTNNQTVDLAYNVEYEQQKARNKTKQELSIISTDSLKKHQKIGLNYITIA